MWYEHWADEEPNDAGTTWDEEDNEENNLEYYSNGYWNDLYDTACFQQLRMFWITEDFLKLNMDHLLLQQHFDFSYINGENGNFLSSGSGLASLGRFELPTPGLGNLCSILLSYRDVVQK